MKKGLLIFALICSTVALSQNKKDKFGDWKYEYVEYQTNTFVNYKNINWITKQKAKDCFLQVVEYRRTGENLIVFGLEGGKVKYYYTILSFKELEEDKGSYVAELRSKGGRIFSYWTLVITGGEKAVMVRNNGKERRVLYVKKP